MLKLHTTYKHTNNKDVAFIPLNLEKESADSLTFYGKWVNIVNVPHTIDYDEITIKTTDLQHWKEYTQP